MVVESGILRSIPSAGPHKPTSHAELAGAGGHPLLDGNKRASCACLLKFVYRNGYEWSRPPNDGIERDEIALSFVAVPVEQFDDDPSGHGDCLHMHMAAKRVAEYRG